MPGAASQMLGGAFGLSAPWLQWWTETLGRMSAAGLVVAATALLDVYLYWRHLKGVAPVIWPLEGQR